MNISEIKEYYNKNKQFYTNLKEQIQNNISGRICHHGVVVLNVLIKYYNINNYLEIGSHNGASMSYVVRQKTTTMNCYGIDLFENTFGHYKKDEISLERTYSNIQKNNLSKSNINLIQGDSSKDSTIDKLKNLLSNKTIDLLFIDGDHSYNMVKSDFETYSKFLSNNAIIVFDDYNKKWKEVIKFVNTIGEDFERIGLVFDNEMIYKKL